MNYVKIDGKAYDVLVTALERGFSIEQSKNAGRTLAEGAREVLDPLGTFITYTVTFKRRKGKEKVFDELWEYIIQPRRDGVPVEIVYNQDMINFEAYFRSGTQGLKRIDEKNKKVYWGEFSVDIIPIEAQVKPI